MSSRSRSGLLTAGFLALATYFWIASFVFVPYYNWLYARDNGFVRWFLLGEVVATAKAFVWPYYISCPGPGTTTLADQPSRTRYESARYATPDERALRPDRVDEQDESLRHLGQSIRFQNLGSALSRRSNTGQCLTGNDVREVVRYAELALSEAQKVNAGSLDQIWTGFADHFRAEYVEGLTRFIRGYQQSDHRAFAEGQLLMNSWGEWYTANVHSGWYPRQRSPD